MKKQTTTAKVGYQDPDRYPLGKFSKRLANRVTRKKAKLSLRCSRCGNPRVGVTEGHTEIR